MNRIKAALIHNRKVTRYITIGIVFALGAVGAFSASFAIAQETSNDEDSSGTTLFAVWHTFSNGAVTISGSNNSMRALVGQTALGESQSQDENPNTDFDFDLTLGFHAGVVAGTQSLLRAPPDVRAPRSGRPVNCEPRRTQTRQNPKTKIPPPAPLKNKGNRWGRGVIAKSRRARTRRIYHHEVMKGTKEICHRWMTMDTDGAAGACF